VGGPISNRAATARGAGRVTSTDARRLAGTVAIKLTAKASNTPNRVPLTHSIAERARRLCPPGARTDTLVDLLPSSKAKGGAFVAVLTSPLSGRSSVQRRRRPDGLLADPAWSWRNTPPMSRQEEIIGSPAELTGGICRLPNAPADRTAAPQWASACRRTGGAEEITADLRQAPRPPWAVARALLRRRRCRAHSRRAPNRDLAPAPPDRTPIGCER
jgi:hypothetical protein